MLVCSIVCLLLSTVAIAWGRITLAGILSCIGNTASCIGNTAGAWLLLSKGHEAGAAFLIFCAAVAYVFAVWGYVSNLGGKHGN